MQSSAEEVSHGGEISGDFRGGCFPLPIEVALRFLSADLRHAYETQVWVFCGHDLQVGVVRVVKSPSHVRLPGTDPNFADQYVFVFQFVLSLDRQGERLGRCLHGLERDPPRAVLVGLRLVRLPGNGNGDFFSFVGPTPHWIGMVALKHHVAPEDRWGLYFGECRACQDEGGEDSVDCTG